MKVSIHNDSVARNYFVSSVRQKVLYEKLKLKVQYTYCYSFSTELV